MANKKYNFTKLLEEYNEKHETGHKLNLSVSRASITHCLESGDFTVTYTLSKESTPRKRSLFDFIYYNVTPNINTDNVKSFILHKEEQNLSLKIEVWPPSKIMYAYLEDNYFSVSGNLGQSCMRKKEMQKALSFYIKNKIRIVVVVGGNNKIQARALLWDNVRSTKLKNPFTYLDRVYARSETLLSLLYDLATTNNWKRYPSTTVDQMERCYYKEDINAAGMCHLPYGDTFRFLHLKRNLLTSGVGSSILKHLNISDSYVTLNVHNNRAYYPQLDPDRVREAITSQYISKKDAIFVKRYDAYVLKKNIANIKGTYYSTHDNKVVKSPLDGFILKVNSIAETFTNNLIDKTEAVHSTKYDGYMHKSNIVDIRGEMYHKGDTDITRFNDKYYHISQCFTNYDRKGMNDELATQTGYIHHPQDYTPYWRRTKVDDKNSKYNGLSRKGNPIPKECAIIAYDIVYSPIIDAIEYQKVYFTDRKGLIQLVTGELIVSSPENKQHLKKFNNKWYIKQDFEAPDKRQLVFSFMKRTKYGI